jgi:hypothetical protein
MERGERGGLLSASPDIAAPGNAAGAWCEGGRGRGERLVSNR